MCMIWVLEQRRIIYFRYVHLVDMSDIVGKRMVSKVTMFVEKL